MTHYYAQVPKLGNVALSRHAQAEAKKDGISDTVIHDILFNPVKPDVPDGADIIWREKSGVRLVIILRPKPFKGAKLVKTMYRVMKQAQAKK